MNFHIKFTYYIYFVPSLSIIFCATLFSGAQYRYDALEDWEVLVQNFLTQLPHVTSLLGNYALPLIWTADFMLDTNEAGEDCYI